MNTRLKAPPVKLPADYEEEAKEKKPFIDRRRFMNYTGCSAFWAPSTSR